MESSMKVVGDFLWQFPWATVGTWAAVLVALGVAFKTDRRQRQESVAKAGVVAARICATVEQAYRTLDGFSVAMTFQKADDHDFKQFAQTIRTHFQALDAIGIAQLTALAALDKPCAYQLARATDLLGGIEKFFEDVAEVHFINQDIYRDMRRRAISKWEVDGEEAVALLSACQQVLRRVALEKAPVPTAEERYADPDTRPRYMQLISRLRWRARSMFSRD